MPAYASQTVCESGVPAMTSHHRLAHSFRVCSRCRMERIDKALIAEAINAAPGWVRIGITAPSPYIREDAINELAQAILDTIEEPPAACSNSQIGLEL